MMKMKNLFTIFLFSFLVLPMHPNTLIITRGPVCSGMGSYLANAIKSLDNSYYIFSQNDLFNGVCHQLFNTVFPYHMEIISNAIDQENIVPAIIYYQPIFKDSILIAKLQAMQAIQYIRQILDDSTSESFSTALHLVKNHAEMEELAYHAACKHNVVWEKRTYSDWNYDTTEIEKLFDNVLNVVTYCHPTAMIQQWLEKNTNAMTEKKAFLRRRAKQVLTTFFNNFQPVGEQQDAIVMLTRNEFDCIIEEVASYIQTVPDNEFANKGLFTSGEFTLEELFNFKAEIYKKFDFENLDYIELAPTLYYDVLLSSKEDCLQFAQELTNS